MKIAVVTDSATYLNPEDVKKYNIHVVPITVIFGKQTFRDNVDITSEEFYKRMAADAIMPSTSQITLGQMQEMFDQLADEGYDAVISIHLSSGITTFFSNLEQFVPSVTNIKVYPFDSLIASAGEANLALLAARLIEAGKTPEEIIAALTKFRDTIDAYFVVDDLSHLVHTGRLSNASSLVGNLLRVKPILTFNDTGQIVAIEREHTMHRAYNAIKKKVAHAYETSQVPLRFTVINADNAVRQEQWVTDLHQSFPDMVIDESILGPVLGVHVGAGTMAILWAYDWQKWPL